MPKKPSFLERLTGTAAGADQFADEMDMEIEEDAPFEGSEIEQGDQWAEQPEERDEEGELPVDMYHTSDNVVIRALIAGVRPDDLDIAITRDMVTIKGSRDEDQEAADEDYYHRELYWGSFRRTLLLPEEVHIDEAEAREKHGLLEIILPKVDKDRSTKLKVKTHSSK